MQRGVRRSRAELVDRAAQLAPRRPDRAGKRLGRALLGVVREPGMRDRVVQRVMEVRVARAAERLEQIGARRGVVGVEPADRGAGGARHPGRGGGRCARRAARAAPATSRTPPSSAPSQRSSPRSLRGPVGVDEVVQGAEVGAQPAGRDARLVHGFGIVLRSRARARWRRDASRRTRTRRESTSETLARDDFATVRRSTLRAFVRATASSCSSDLRVDALDDRHLHPGAVALEAPRERVVGEVAARGSRRAGRAAGGR